MGPVKDLHPYLPFTASDRDRVCCRIPAQDYNSGYVINPKVD
jgi:hypothetical protein